MDRMLYKVINGKSRLVFQVSHLVVILL